ncbi:hypothetical protein ACUND9_25120 [Serratia sp. IR-2025]
MKPMLKKDFFSAIENLLKAGFQPRFYTVNSGRIGLITFTDKNGTKQVEQVYSCTSLAANTFGKRFTTWLEEIFQKHNEEKVADSGFEVGSRVWDKLMYTLRTISEIRAGGGCWCWITVHSVHWMKCKKRHLKQTRWSQRKSLHFRSC